MHLNTSDVLHFMPFHSADMQILMASFLAWLVICVQVAKVGSSRHLFDHLDLPKFADSDVLEVYHLRSFPLQLVTTSIGTFSIQTSGIALRSQSRIAPIVLQFRPRSFSTCFLPKIRLSTIQSATNDSTSTQNFETVTNVDEIDDQNLVLEWNHEADITYSNEIDTHYWQQSTFLAHINGVVYKDYILWIEGFHSRNQLFSPQSICSDEYDELCFTHAMTWDTFLEQRYVIFALVIYLYIF